MNYLTEIRLFYDWLETHHLSPSSIALWHGLMYIANRAGWEENLCVAISRIESRTQLSRSAIYRERKRLQEAGLLRYIERDGRQSSIYNLLTFEGRVVFQSDTQSEIQLPQSSEVVSQVMSQIETQSGTQPGTIYKLNETKQSKKNKSEKEVAGEPAPLPINSKSKREKSSAQKEKTKRALFAPGEWLKTIEEPWREIMRQWLEYKVARKEGYKTEMGARKCYSMLRNLAMDNPATAQRIIDQSMANNWAGLFALRDGLARGHPPDGRQYGQRIGQIIQSDDEQKRQRYIDKLKKAGKK